MMKNYAMLLLLFLGVVATAQETISFEASEGYTLGTLNTQNGWEVTDDNQGGYLLNQVVTDEKATDGTYAFKNAFEPDFNPQWLPIFGAAKTFDTPKTHEDFVISFDMMVTEANGADFEFTLFGIDANDDFVPVAGIAMEYRGLIYTIDDINYTAFYIEDAAWTPNTWLNIKIEVSDTELKYYLNNVLAHTRSNFTMVDIVGFNMLHNNYGGSAFYDNFIMQTGSLGIEDIVDTTGIRIYPNPVKDVLHVEGITPDQISTIAIYNLRGQKLMESKSMKNINLSTLSEGVYLLNIQTLDNKTHTQKLIKN